MLTVLVFLWFFMFFASAMPNYEREYTPSLSTSDVDHHRYDKSRNRNLYDLRQGNVQFNDCEFDGKQKDLLSEHFGRRKSFNSHFSEEYNLHQDLLVNSNYSKHIRPVRLHDCVVTVYIGMCVMMIEDLVERDQTMVTSSCLKILWFDEFLRWNPSEYGDLSWIALDSQSIWVPDIAIVNSPNPLGLTKKHITVGVSHLGEVGFFPSGRLITRCNLYITFFPFDRQNCEIRFESWIYHTPYMMLELYPGDEAIDLKEYYDNFQWSLQSYKVQLAHVSYDDKNFSSITITYRLWRKPTFYVMYFIFPQFLLSALQTLSHTLPVEHPGRMSMLTALFIGTSVTHGSIGTHMPKSSDSMSILQIYLTFMSCNLVIVLLITFLMLYTVLRHPNEAPSLWSMIHAFFCIVWPKKYRKASKVDTGYGSMSFNKINPNGHEEEVLEISLPPSTTDLPQSSNSYNECLQVNNGDNFSLYPIKKVERVMCNEALAYLSGSCSVADNEKTTESEHDSNESAVTSDTGYDNALRRRWVEYCVALDKSIMYFNGLINVAVPFCLFYVLPAFNNSEL